VDKEDMMSASTRTIQQSTGLGSILTPLALAGAALIATVGIAWGAMNLTATHPGAQSTQSVIRPPVVIDLGSRDLAQPGSAPVFVDHGGRFDTVTAYRRLRPE
jgi:hypothetical protein